MLHTDPPTGIFHAESQAAPSQLLGRMRTSLLTALLQLHSDKEIEKGNKQLNEGTQPSAPLTERKP